MMYVGVNKSPCKTWVFGNSWKHILAESNGFLWNCLEISRILAPWAPKKEAQQMIQKSGAKHPRDIFFIFEKHDMS